MWFHSNYLNIANIEWLIYQLNKPDKILKLRNLLTGREQFFNDVSYYLLSDEGNTVILKKDIRRGHKSLTALQWINIATNNTKLIWEGNKVNNMILDGTGTQLAFIAGDSINNPDNNSLWHYQTGMDPSILLANKYSQE